MSSLGESSIYCAVNALAFCLRLLPWNVALLVGKTVGHAAYRLSTSKRKRTAYNNLRIAFCQTKSDRAIRKILRQCYEHYAQNFVELLRLPLVNKSNFKKIVSLKGEEHIRASLARGRGVIFLAIHSGNWELANMTGSLLGYPYNLVANPQTRTDDSRLNDLLNAYRSAGGCKIIFPQSGTREIIRRLKANEIVTLVADQGGSDGELTEFFGREASMSTGAIRLALKYDVPICPIEIHRNRAGRHQLTVDPPLELIRTGKGADADRRANLSHVMKKFEAMIHRHPHEYMWFYKIWKYSKNANVLILHDGKTGHLRQSQTVAKAVAKALAGKDRIAGEQTVEIFFRTPAMKRVCSLIGIFGQWFPFLRSTAWLEILLSPESFKRLMAVKADYLISCGSSLAPVHFLSLPWQMAKGIVILKPGLLSLRGFDLVVLPQHDQPAVVPAKAKVVITRAAPNLIDEHYLREQSDLLLKRYSHLKNSYRTKIGVLIGGNTKHVVFRESAVKILIHQLKEVAHQLNADLLLTTSRRTPEAIEQLFFRELKKFDRCPLLISASQNNIPEAVGGILGLSDYVVVSGESISMVSEAVSSGKKTVVFRVGESGAVTEFGKNKYERFVDRLNEQGYLISCSIRDVGRSIYNVMREKIRLKALNDREVLQKAVERII